MNTSKQCPSCGEHNVRCWIEKTTFAYGVGDDAAEISVQLPVHRCDACCIEFIDGFAEKLQHAAICRYRGVMTPDEIVAVRKMYGSRATFGQLTRIGEAAISRWEDGAEIQNAAYDQFLYLLKFPDNIARLKVRPKHR